MMNSQERMQAAMQHELPDRVPVMCQLALGHYFLHSPFRAADIWFDSDTFAQALVDRQEAYRFDGILVNLPGRPPDWKERLESCVAAPGGEKITWQSGLETLVGDDDNPRSYAAGGGNLPRADLEAINPADPATYRHAGYVWNTWHAPELWDIDPDADLADPAAYPRWYVSAVEAAKALAPGVSIHAEVFSPFTHLLEVLGYEQALIGLMEAPELCHTLLEVFTEQVRAQVSLYAACEPDAILVSSAFAGAGFLSPAMYSEFVLPYETCVFQAIHEYGLIAYVHTCGAIGDRLDLMAQSGVDGIDTLDPPPLGTVDLARAKEEFGRRFFFKGNLDGVNEILRADDRTFEQAVAERLRIGTPGGGYILSTACSVPPHVRPERLKQLTELAGSRSVAGS